MIPNTWLRVVYFVFFLVKSTFHMLVPIALWDTEVTTNISFLTEWCRTQAVIMINKAWLSRPLKSPIMKKWCNMMIAEKTGLRFGDWFWQHFNDISSRAHKPVSQHYNERNHRGKCDFSLTALRSCSSDKHFLKILEQYLILQVECLRTAGMNSQFRFLWITLFFL